MARLALRLLEIDYPETRAEACALIARLKDATEAGVTAADADGIPF